MNRGRKEKKKSRSSELGVHGSVVRRSKLRQGNKMVLHRHRQTPRCNRRACFPFCMAGSDDKTVFPQHQPLTG